MSGHNCPCAPEESLCFFTSGNVLSIYSYY